MGNEESKSSGKHSHAAAKPHAIDQRWENAFKKFTGGNESASYDQFLSVFGEDLSESLWRYFTAGDDRSVSLSVVQYSSKCGRLLGTSTDVYVVELQPVHHLIKICSEAANAGAVQGDEHFINKLVEKMGSSTDDMVSWRSRECPRFCHDVQALLSQYFLGTSKHTRDFASDILTPLQMWFVQCSLPTSYFPNADTDGSSCGQWTPLYTSAMQGISVNRFETNVFDYKGATVSIFTLSDKRTVVLATDQEWRHSGSRFGGPDTCYMEISPDIRKIETSASIYCNFKIRSAAFGLSFRRDMEIDKEMSNVVAVEVWGCGGANTLQQQQKLKQWQSNQVEKRKRVPLPGNWDDNPDKTLLEMAGFQFSNERENMNRPSC